MQTPRLVILAALLWTGAARGQFVAFWDNVPGTNETQTHPNTTVTNLDAKFGRVRSIALKNITNGLPTPVWLTLTNVALESGYALGWVNQASNPAPGTPLYNCFYYTATNPVTHQPTNCSYVYFAHSTNCDGVQISNAAMYYIFTGLNPNARYSFKGGAVRGGDTNSEMRRRWTQVELAGAGGYCPRMTSNVLTSAQTPDLGPNQVAVNFGCNHTPDTGDMVDWENVAPSADGSFSVICSRYTGAVPGGSSNGGGAFAITGFRLEEYFPPRLAITPQAGGTCRVSWTPAGGTLEVSTNLAAWRTSVITNGGTASMSGGTRFYRVTP